MGTTPRRTCARCGAVNRGPCPRCTTLRTRAQDAARPSAAERGYDWQWAGFSQQWLSRFPWCGQRVDGQLHLEHSRCVQRVERNYADCTDHIVPLAAGGKQYAESNLQSLCTSCNTWKAINVDAKLKAAAARKALPYPSAPPAPPPERISCGCCSGPESDRCVCWHHQDTPGGRPPRTCSRHRFLATDTQPAPALPARRACGCCDGPAADCCCCVDHAAEDVPARTCSGHRALATDEQRADREDVTHG